MTDTHAEAAMDGYVEMENVRAMVDKLRGSLAPPYALLVTPDVFRSLETTLGGDGRPLLAAILDEPEIASVSRIEGD